MGRTKCKTPSVRIIHKISSLLELLPISKTDNNTVRLIRAPLHLLIKEQWCDYEVISTLSWFFQSDVILKNRNSGRGRREERGEGCEVLFFEVMDWYAGYVSSHMRCQAGCLECSRVWELFIIHSSKRALHNMFLYREWMILISAEQSKVGHRNTMYIKIWCCISLKGSYFDKNANWCLRQNIKHNIRHTSIVMIQNDVIYMHVKRKSFPNLTMKNYLKFHYDSFQFLPMIIHKYISPGRVLFEWYRHQLLATGHNMNKKNKGK